MYPFRTDSFEQCKGADAMTALPAARGVSVIICAYNTADYLVECLDSVFAQTYPGYEVIVVNDGSTDDTQNILEDYAARFPDKMTVLKQENLGPSAARNRGLDMARGEYVAFVDSDDTLLPDYLSLLIEKALATGAQVVSCGFDKVLNDKIIASYTPAAWDVCLGGDHYSLMVIVCARVYRRDFLNLNNLRFYPGELFEDIAFSLSVNFLAAGITAVPFQGYRYRVREHSTMGSARKGITSSRKLPFAGIEQAVVKLQAGITDRNRRQAFEFAVAKALAGLLFQVLRRHNRAAIRAMSRFCMGLMSRYFPRAMANRYIQPFRIKGFPFVQKAAIAVFAAACRLRVLYPVAFLITRF
jgi:glycosyltransferase involved in cell wall biosynthesis